MPEKVMTVMFLIPSYLRVHAREQNQVEISISATTVAEALAALWLAFPGLRDRVVDEQGQVRQHVNIFVGDANIRDCGGLAARVRDGCEIMIVPNITGG
ncbi:MAG: MoaD/ThiS family protein [Acidobacteria bacterium]|nr:MoaD/ThiS family protein [Acidobacteriota bacterium]